ncbi:hypothetical protein H0H87_004356, partial [Tephrocybe sp. NHM501043]
MDGLCDRLHASAIGMSSMSESISEEKHDSKDEYSLLKILRWLGVMQANSSAPSIAAN